MPACIAACWTSRFSLDRWRSLEPETLAEQGPLLAALIQAQAAGVQMAQGEPAWDPSAAPREIERLTRAVTELEYTLIPDGLHVIGAPPSVDSRAAMLDVLNIANAAQRETIEPAAVGGPRDPGYPCTRSMAATCVRLRAGTCCAPTRCCRPGATCTASTRSASRARSRCRPARSRPNSCSSGTPATAPACPRRWRWCCGAQTTSRPKAARWPRCCGCSAPHPGMTATGA